MSRPRTEEIAFAALRMVAGFMFMCHGLPKLFGWFGQTVPTGSQLWIGGIIELGTGALVMLGAFTRPAALLASGTMAVAFFQFHAHAKGHILPIVNGGDAAALYCFVFLLFGLRGPGIWSIYTPRRSLHS